MLIDEAVTRSEQNYIKGGTEKGKKCVSGGKKGPWLVFPHIR